MIRWWKTVACGAASKRVEGIEPSSLAWKAIALPLSYTRGVSVLAGDGPSLSGRCLLVFGFVSCVDGGRGNCWVGCFGAWSGVSNGLRGMGWEVGSAGFEPAKAEPLDLQSSPFDRSGNSPHVMVISVWNQTSSEPKNRRVDTSAPAISRSGLRTGQACPNRANRNPAPRQSCPAVGIHAARWCNRWEDDADPSSVPLAIE